MLDSETKRKIDTLRDILVGKIPNPQSQVEQITTGLIYKFMNDMDEESIELGGDASFFVGDYKKYSWNNLFDSKLGGVDKVNLYSEAIENMYLNPAAPKLFRDIFKNAFLPFKDPSTLNMFLKEINDFHYSHSEKLGDAFEYLISIMGSQGDAGQFRTPRHIIDFIVEIINPQKDETILDPGCGTAGFLISSYKHILKSNTATKLGDQLSAEDRKIVGENLSGYDISPEMIRLSLVNMYLHGFKTPKVDEYDTLSSEDKWNEYFDVILANPPFFSPKGGIQPHKRFGVDSKKAEVLFTSYILEHLKPNGRAGIIVPEGVIFQTGKAYKELRKQLIETALIGVISLPAGVFNPYSGVKTSILILDKKLYKERDSIFFAEVKNDGYNLGSQRKEIKKNDLPIILDFIQQENHENNLITSVLKEKLHFSDFSLNVNKFKSEIENPDYEYRSLLDISDFVRGVTYSKKDEIEDAAEGSGILRANNISLGGQLNFDSIKYISNEIKLAETKKLKRNDILICTASGSKSHIGKVALINDNLNYYFGGFMGVLRANDVTHPNYLYYQLNSKRFNDYLGQVIMGANINNINKGILEDYKIPLPPIKIQQEIVDELVGYQKIIDGCKQVVENYKPTIDVDPSWEIFELGEISSLKYGLSSSAADNGKFRFIRISDIDKNGLLINYDKKYIDISNKDKEYILKEGDILMARTGATYGKCLYFDGKDESVYAGYLIKITLDNTKILNRYFWYFSQSFFFNVQKEKLVSGGAQPQFNAPAIKRLRVPLVSLEIQKEIVQKIEEEIKVIEGNKKLIEIYTKKIQDRINKVWGE